MNPNATIRQSTQAHADMLSASYNEMLEGKAFNNFDVAYYDFPIEAMIKEYIA